MFTINLYWSTCTLQMPSCNALLYTYLCRQATKDPLNTYHSVKRFIGRQLEDLPRGAAQQARSRMQHDYLC